MTLVSMSGLLKDMYPRPGERIKQWVVDTRREHKWEQETCPHDAGYEHRDNTGAICRNSYGPVLWVDLNHDCCHECGELYEVRRAWPEIQAWLAEKAKRPPIEQDRSKLSDEIEPHYELRATPALALLKGKR